MFMRVANQTGSTARSVPSIIVLKDTKWIERQRYAGQIVARCLEHLRQRVEDKTSLTLLELSREAEQIILDGGCTPTFKNYKGFPEAVCISLNKQIVHGIPNEQTIHPGDVVKFDLGATFEKAIADSAITCILGEPLTPEHDALVRATRESLYSAIRAIRVGARLGVIGNAIYRHARSQNFGVVTEYGGHGLEEDRPHAAPFVPNRSGTEEGLVMQAGMTLAIEPMLTAGVPRTSVARDGWTVSTEDVGAHAEHTIFIHTDRIEIMTWRNDDTIERDLRF